MRQKLNLEEWGEIRFSGPREDLDSFDIDDGIYEIFFGEQILYMRVINSHFLSKTESVCVCLNAAISGRENKTPPYFSGEGISNSIGSCMISFSDPSTHIRGIDLGWYVGNENWLGFQKDLVNLIEMISENLSKRLIIFGGSGGGYASFALSKLLTREALIIGMNPQFDISLYPSCNNFATKAFPKSKISDVQNFSKKREEWNHFFSQEGLITTFTHQDLNPLCDYLLLQNWNDTHHLRLHTPLMLPCLDTLSLSKFYGTNNNLSYFIGPWGDRHSVVWKEHIGLVLAIAISGGSGSQINNKLAAEFLPENSDSNHSHSRIPIPPRIQFEKTRNELNLVRFTADQFGKNDAMDSLLGLDHLSPLLVNESSNLEIFAVVASLQCWFELIQTNEELMEEIWETEYFAHRISAIYHLCQGFTTRPAMIKHQPFLREIIQFHLEGADARNIPVDSDQYFELRNFLLQFE